MKHHLLNTLVTPSRRDKHEQRFFRRQVGFQNNVVPIEELDSIYTFSFMHAHVVNKWLATFLGRKIALFKLDVKYIFSAKTKSGTSATPLMIVR